MKLPFSEASYLSVPTLIDASEYHDIPHIILKSDLHSSFESLTQPVDGVFQQIDPVIDENLSRIIGIEDTAVVAGMRPMIMDSIKPLMDGIEYNGQHGLGLLEISKWKLNREYKHQNIKQQSGYAAEVLSTWKENLISQANKAGEKIFRADDLPELFAKNDQFVDKVRMSADGEILERIQVKFFGKNGKEWLSKMMSKDCEKYLDGHVDSLECPKDYYNEILSEISKRRESLTQQLERVKAAGKDDVAQKIQHSLDKLNRIDDMLKQSTVTTDEAKFARLHPKIYAAKMFTQEVAKVSNSEGLASGAMAASLTFTVSTVDNLSDFVDGKISASDMALDIMKDTAAAGALGYSTAFISTAVSQTLKASSNQLIRSVGGSSLPTAVVSFAVESYDDISAYARNEITGEVLAYNLGNNAAMVAGGVAGGQVGMAVGSVAGPAGAAVGGIVGGIIGCAVTSEAYATAVEAGAEGAAILADKAQEYAEHTLDLAKEAIPDQVDSIRASLNEYAQNVKLPFRV